MRKLAIIAIIAVVSVALATNTRPVLSGSMSADPDDTTGVRTKTLDTLHVKGSDKTQGLKDALNQSLHNGLTMPGKKSLSDVIGKKTTDKILHPFARKQRLQERNKERTKRNLEKIDAAKSYEDELTEAINRQLWEDSMEAIRKNLKK